jgi:hypothetical protein
MDLDATGTYNTCTFYIDTEDSGDIGVGAVATGGPYTSTVSATDIDGIFNYDTAGDISTVTDDWGVCDVTGGDFLDAGTRCE